MSDFVNFNNHRPIIMAFLLFMHVGGVLVTSYVNGTPHWNDFSISSFCRRKTDSRYKMENLLRSILGTNFDSTLSILRNEEFDVDSIHSLDKTDLKEIGKCTPFVIDAKFRFYYIMIFCFLKV